MLNPSARKGSLLTLLCVLISVLATADAPGFGFSCLWSIIGLVSIYTACRWGTSTQFQSQLNLFLIREWKAKSHKPDDAASGIGSSWASRMENPCILAFLSGWLYDHPWKSQFGSRKMRGKLERKMLPCHSKLSASSIKKHAICARTMHSSCNEVSSQQNKC